MKKHFDLGKENDRIETRRSRSVVLCHLFRQKSSEYGGAGISTAAGAVARHRILGSLKNPRERERELRVRERKEKRRNEKKNKT